MYVHYSPGGAVLLPRRSMCLYCLYKYFPISFRIFRITYTGDLHLPRKGTNINWYAFKKKSFLGYVGCTTCLKVLKIIVDCLLDAVIDNGSYVPFLCEPQVWAYTITQKNE